MGEHSAKRTAGEAAARLVEGGQYLGLGTGSTTAFTICAIGHRIRQEGLHVSGVPTSAAAARLARECGVPLVTLDEVETLDIAFDGADEVSPTLDLIKGRGAAHTREKIVASLARRFVVLVDESKMVQVLGTRSPVPVEVLPMATAPVMRALETLGANPELRMGVHKDGPVVSDQGFWIVDAYFDGIRDPAAMDRQLQQIPGVLDHGLFVGLTTSVLIGLPSGKVRRLTAT